MTVVAVWFVCCFWVPFLLLRDRDRDSLWVACRVVSMVFEGSIVFSSFLFSCDLTVVGFGGRMVVSWVRQTEGKRDERQG